MTLLRSRAGQLNGNSGKMGLKQRIYAGFSPFLFLCDVNMMLKMESVYFHYSKQSGVESPIKIW